MTGTLEHLLEKVMARFTGAEAHEVSALLRPTDGSGHAGRQAETIYRELAALLAAERASFRDLASETLHLRDARRDLSAVLDARARILAEVGQPAAAPTPCVVQQPPVEHGACFELSASALVPHRRDGWSIRDVQAAPSCACEGCARSGARLVRLGSRTSLHSSNVYGVGRDVLEQATDMLGAAERLLHGSGFGFHDVVRTWIYLRDIDRDYDTLNRARREFFGRCGIELRPASTGVGGTPFPDGHDVTMTLRAVRSAVPATVAPMSTPSLIEAWTYGADFSRGLRATDADRTTLYVSGTASIDEAGHTVHAGDLTAQVERMLHNIETLLSRQGASVAHVLSGVTYLRDATDGPVVRALLRRRGFDGFPLALVEARLCRPELLCETEVMAALPLETS